MKPAARAAKDRAMALEMIARAKRLAPGTVAGVAGNTLAHSERLCALVRELAAETGVDVSHVTFKPIATEQITKADVDRATGRRH